MGVIDHIWHWFKRMEFVSAEIVNSETGTTDFACTCIVCKLNGRVRYG